MSSDVSTQTAREVREAYRTALQARREYRRSVGSSMERFAHEQLHEATIDYYETLRPILKSANATEEHWEDRQMWPVAPVTTEVAMCPNCRFEAEPEHAGKTCSRCGDADVGVPQLEIVEVQAIDDDGEPLYQWAEGLQVLDDVRLGVTTETRTYSDALGEHTKTEVRKSLLDPQKLYVVLDVLDEAMEGLDLLAEIDDDLPRDDLEVEA